MPVLSVLCCAVLWYCAVLCCDVLCCAMVCYGLLSSLIRDKSKRSINLWDFTFHDDKATIEKLGANTQQQRREILQREISDVYLEHKAPCVTHPNDEKKR
jgi:hypothetical protein